MLKIGGFRNGNVNRAFGISISVISIITSLMTSGASRADRATDDITVAKSSGSGSEGSRIRKETGRTCRSWICKVRGGKDEERRCVRRIGAADCDKRADDCVSPAPARSHTKARF